MSLASVDRGWIECKSLVLPGRGARGQQRLAVHIQHVSGIAGQARTRLEEMPYDVRCDHHHFVSLSATARISAAWWPCIPVSPQKSPA